MGRVIHCREGENGKQYALFSTVCMGYITDRMSKAEVVQQAYEMEVAYKNDLVTQFGESVYPYTPSMETWWKAADFAGAYGNSELMPNEAELAKCVPGCKCYLHQEIRSELYMSWW